MKFVRFRASEQAPVLSGVLESEERIREITGEPWAQWSYAEGEYRLGEVILEAPLVPRSIIGLGKNYLAPGEAHPDELPAVPVLFYKPALSVIGPEADIVLPPGVDEVKFESELAVVIGKTAQRIKADEAEGYIFGYCVANDVTALSLFHPDGHWTLGKAADTFLPLGPLVTTELDLNAVRVCSSLNGKEYQNCGLERMIMSIPEMIARISRYVTLVPGDVLLTGTPAGAVMMRAGDRIECRIDGIGSLSNPVATAPAGGSNGD
ncbi:fumarylacetoacetate hydrolase family protein [Paenibacillus daejeonensis]|uniref:fumarylacetoacetate hydrolase family protein n=1 Tax=Paenibacillus daejeonensis TaxID=135193 RepID=UPI00036A6AE3|nr:fumarylacetoacetate hydrolase family protein [Paenibacillus daejeonensis]